MDSAMQMSFKSLLNSPGVRKFIIGALLGAAVFLIVAGIAEILIARENQCLSEIYRMRIMPNRYEICLAEWESYFARAASRGIVWVIDNDSPPLLGWAVMGVFMALVGGACAQLSRGMGIAVYLTVAIAVVAFFAGLGYILQFIVI